MPGNGRLLVVHCIDTEGPLVENIEDTFSRIESAFGVRVPASHENLKALQAGAYPLEAHIQEIQQFLSPDLLSYNESWCDIRRMLENACSMNFREELLDDVGNPWSYSWFCMDHMGYTQNPRNKALGYGTIFNFYQTALNKQNAFNHDEINWHFHPLSFTRNPLQSATSYVNSYDVLYELLARRIIEHQWFPVVNRPGYQSTRPDSHFFLEQWIPFDYANQAYEFDDGQADVVGGRFGDWRRAPNIWGGYHPDCRDYQTEGRLKRWIFRCLNVGTRFRLLKKNHVEQAFKEAKENGLAILAFTDHDYRDITKDVRYVRELIEAVKIHYPDVQLEYKKASDAARIFHSSKEMTHSRLSFTLEINGNVLSVHVREGNLFGPQPFLAIKSKEGKYYHDNFDVQIPGKHYTYILDDQTIKPEDVDTLGVGSAGKCGYPFVETLKV